MIWLGLLFYLLALGFAYSVAAGPPSSTPLRRAPSSGGDSGPDSLGSPVPASRRAARRIP